MINALRAHLSEYGFVTSNGPGGVTALMKLLHEGQEKLPAHARSAFHMIGAQLRLLASEVDRFEAQILAWHRADDTSRRLAFLPGTGPITASAIAAAGAAAGSVDIQIRCFWNRRMEMQRRKFSREFKLEAVKLVREPVPADKLRAAAAQIQWPGLLDQQLAAARAWIVARQRRRKALEAAARAAEPLPDLMSASAGVLKRLVANWQRIVLD